jgi:hypothetical protein
MNVQLGDFNAVSQRERVEGVLCDVVCTGRRGGAWLAEAGYDTNSKSSQTLSLLKIVETLVPGSVV